MNTADTSSDPTPEDGATIKRRFQEGIRRYAPVVAKGSMGIAGGATIGALVAGGMMPFMTGGITPQTFAIWLGSIGSNALANWVGEWAQRAGKQFIEGGESDEQAQLKALVEDLRVDLASNTTLHDDVVLLFERTDAIPTAIESLANQVEAQVSLIQLLRDDLRANTSLQDRLHIFLEREIAKVMENTTQSVALLTRIAQSVPALQDYVVDFTQTIEEASQDFEGRDFVFTEIDAFVREYHCGYYRIIADAGLGKTVLAAKVAERFRAAAFFFNAQMGLTHPGHCLEHLCAQLIARYDLADRYSRIPNRAGETGIFLRTLLAEASQKPTTETPIVIVIDALDEADPTPAGHNWLHLPNQLPDGVYFILTHRPGDYPIHTDAQAGVGSAILTITWDSSEQQQDIAAFLRRQVGKRAVRQVLEAVSPTVSEKEFVDKLQQASQGNFMYLRIVLNDITSREPGYFPLDLTTLPRGLNEYYARFWSQMEQVRHEDGFAAWTGLYKPIIGLLGVAKEPVTAEWLADHTDCDGNEVRELALERWQRFLSRSSNADTGTVARADADTQASTQTETWRIVHQSFSDFLTNKLEMPAYHGRIAQYYQLNPALWSAHGGYARRHLSTHLHQAGSHKDLFDLVENEAWYNAQMSADPSGALFLNDLAQAWAAVEELNSGNVQGGQFAHRMGDEVRYALAATSLRSLSGTVSANMLVALVEAGLWSPQHALAAIQHNPQEWEKCRAIVILAPHLAESMRKELGKIAHSIQNQSLRCRALAAVLPLLPENERLLIVREALEAAGAIDDAKAQVGELTGLAPQFSEGLLDEAMLLVPQVTFQQRAPLLLMDLLPYLPKRDRLPMLNAALELATVISSTKSEPSNFLSEAPKPPQARWEEILRAAVYAVTTVPAEVGFLVVASSSDNTDVPMGWTESRALSVLARHLPKALIDEALSAVRAIENAGARVRCLLALRSHLSAKVRESVLHEALGSAREIGLFYDRVNMLTTIAIDMQGQERLDVLREALDAAREVPNPSFRARELATVVPHLLADEQTRKLISKDEAVSAAKAILLGSNDPEALPVLRAYLSREEQAQVLREALAGMQQIGDVAEQVTAEAMLIPYLPEQERPNVIDLAFAAAWDIESTSQPWERIDALSAVIPLLSDQERIRALDGVLTTCALLNPIVAHSLLLPLIPLVPRNLGLPVLRGIAAAFRNIPDAGRRATSLAELVQYFPAFERLSIQQAALAAVQATGVGIFEGSDRSRALQLLAPHLPGGLLRKALPMARAIEGRDERSRALAALAGYLLKHEQMPVFEEALESGGMGESTAGQIASLADVLAYLARAGYAEEAVGRARTIEDMYWRAKALQAVAMSVPDPLKSELLQGALVVGEKVAGLMQRADVLRALTPYLAEEQQPSAAQEAYNCLRAAIQSSGSVSPVGFLPNLVELLPYLSAEEQGTVMRELLAGIWNLTVADDRYHSLKRLAPYVRQMPRIELYPLWQDTLHRLTELPRKEMLVNLGALAPVVLALGGPLAIAEMSQAVLAVRRRWQ